MRKNLKKKSERPWGRQETNSGKRSKDRREFFDTIEGPYSWRPLKKKK